MSDANSVGLRFFKSPSRTFPLSDAAPVLRALRVVGLPNFGAPGVYVESQEIRNDAQSTGVALVGLEPGGDMAVQMSPRVFDEQLQDGMLNSFTETPNDIGNTAIVTFGAGTIEVDDATQYQVAHLIRLRNEASGLAGDDAVYEITNIAANVLTVVPLAGTDSTAVTALFSADATTELRVVGVIAPTAGDITLTVAGGVGTLTFPTGLLDNAMGNNVALGVGQWFKAAGFVNAAPSEEANVYARISAVDTGTDTVLFAAEARTVSNAAATERVEIYFGDRMENGNDSVSSHYSVFERRFEDQDPQLREVFVGGIPNQLQWNLTPQQIVTMQFTLLALNQNVKRCGTDGVSGDIAELYANTPTDAEADTDPFLNTSFNVGRLGRGTDPIEIGELNVVQDSNFAITRNLERVNGVGVEGTARFRRGEWGVSGGLVTTFDSLDILEQIVGQVISNRRVQLSTSLDHVLRADNGVTYVIDKPFVQFNGGIPEVTGKNTEVTINGTYIASRSSDFGYTVSVQRMHYTR